MRIRSIFASSTTALILLASAFACSGQIQGKGMITFFGYENGDGLLSESSPNTVSVANIEQLYSAVNDPLNAGNIIIMAPGIYMLSANDPQNVPRPNGGRIDFLENMSLQGVIGDRTAVVIDAVNLLTSSYTKPPILRSGAVRMGRGVNTIEWLTIKNAVNGNGGIETEILWPGTSVIRIAHIASTGNLRGIDLRNIGPEEAGRVIDAAIVDNDLYGNSRMGLRIANSEAAGGVITATLSGNRSHDNSNGLVVTNINAGLGRLTVVSFGDHFYNNGFGTNVVGGVSIGVDAAIADGNTTRFTAQGSVFENNSLALGVFGGQVTVFANAASNNTVDVTLRNCQFKNSQSDDINAIAAESSPESIGHTGTANRVRLSLYNTVVPVLTTTDSIPAFPGGMNSVDLFRYFGVSGRVTTPNGLGLRNAAVSITDSFGVRQTATTSTFGFYSFSDVPVGDGYTILVASRRFRFEPRTLDINNNLTDIDLVGME